MIKPGLKGKAEDFSFTLIAGEDLAPTDPTMIGSGDESTIVYQNLTAHNASQAVSDDTWVAQKVNFAAIRQITSIAFKHARDSGTIWTVSVRASLTGADLASGSFNTGGSGSSAISLQIISLSSPLTVEPNTDYFLVWRASGGDEIIRGNTDNVYPNGEAYVSTNAGASWSTHGTVADFDFQVNGGLTEAGKLYRANASLSEKFVGFPYEGVSVDGDAYINPQLIVSGFSDLVPGQVYYLGVNPGTLAISGSVRVGVALTETKLLRTYAK